MMDLDELDRAAGLEPDRPDYHLRRSLARADDDLLECLVRFRKEKGFTQQEVAERMGRHKSAVCNFERLSADPHLSTIRRYAAAIGVMITHDAQDTNFLEASSRNHLDIEDDGELVELFDGLDDEDEPGLIELSDGLEDDDATGLRLNIAWDIDEATDDKVVYLARYKRNRDTDGGGYVSPWTALDSCRG